MGEKNRFILVTGLSGAGKSQTMRFLEDLGYQCVDNLPAKLLGTFGDLVLKAGSMSNRFAVCVDARSGEDLTLLPNYFHELEEKGMRPVVLYLETTDEVLIKRYSETRRRHPAAGAGSVQDGIFRERALLQTVRDRADLLVDTSSISIADLRERIASAFLESEEEGRMRLTIMSFGFKYGVPQEADIVMDVRFLPNPYWEEDLRQLTGNEPEVRDYVLKNEVAQEFLDKGKSLLKFILPQYEKSRKSYLTLAIGCTGGKHRSVAIANNLALYLRGLQFEPRLRHRDMDRG